MERSFRESKNFCLAEESKGTMECRLCRTFVRFAVGYCAGRICYCLSTEMPEAEGLQQACENHYPNNAFRDLHPKAESLEGLLYKHYRGCSRENSYHMQNLQTWLE